MTKKIPCAYIRMIVLYYTVMKVFIKSISEYFFVLRVGKHKLYLQKNIFTSAVLILSKPSHTALNLLQKDFINYALPKILDKAKSGDKIVLDTHLITKKQVKQLPHNPKVEKIYKGKLENTFYKIQLWIIFIIKKFILRKYKKLTWKKLLEKYQLHQWYLITWIK